MGAAPVSYGATYAAPTYAAPTYAAAPVSYGAPLSYGFGATPIAAANFGGTTVVGADRNFDGIPDVLQQPALTYPTAATLQTAPSMIAYPGLSGGPFNFTA